VCFRDWQLNEAVLHVLVADRGGRSSVAELSASDKEWHFTNNAGKPQILTNHALFKYPDTSAFPQSRQRMSMIVSTATGGWIIM